MVRADVRGQGVGRLLMTAFEEWAAGQGDRLVGAATRRAALSTHLSATRNRPRISASSCGRSAMRRWPIRTGRVVSSRTHVSAVAR